MNKTSKLIITQKPKNKVEKFNFCYIKKYFQLYLIFLNQIQMYA